MNETPYQNYEDACKQGASAIVRETHLLRDIARLERENAALREQLRKATPPTKLSQTGRGATA